MPEQKSKLIAKEKYLLEELSNVNVQLIALGQSLMSLGHYLKEHPAQILLTGCNINNPNTNCLYSMDFAELEQCPELITKLLRSYHNIQGKLEKVRMQLESYDEDDDEDDDSE